MMHDLREDERELAGAVLEGSKRRTDQAFGDYYRGRNSSCALGAAYEGVCRLPDTADGVRPQRLDRLSECLEGVVRTCPECSKTKLPLGALIVHLNDAYHLDARTHRGVGRRSRRAARRITRPSLMGHFR
jgi:hypothetical protein